MLVIEKKLTSSSNDNCTYHLDGQVGYLLRLASQRHAIIFQKHIIHRLTPTQFSALVRIHEVTQCSQNRLGRLTAMDAATIKGVVGRLNKKGLVILAADNNDRRRTLISLSPKAVSMMEELFDIGLTITQDNLKPLTSAERHSFLRLLSKLI